MSITVKAAHRYIYHLYRCVITCTSGDIADAVLWTDAVGSWGRRTVR